MTKKYRDLFIEEQYSPVKIKSIKRIKNNQKVFDLSVKDDGTYCVTKDKIIGSNSDMGNKAKLLRSFFRVYARKIEKHNIALLVTNHYTQKIGVMYGSNKTTTGGTALPYAASVRLDLKISDTQIDKKLESLGASAITIKAKTEKNRVFSPKRTVRFVLDFERGVDRYSGLFQILVDLGLAEKNGAWCKLPQWDPEKKFYAKEFPGLIKEHDLLPLIQNMLDGIRHKDIEDEIDIEGEVLEVPEKESPEKEDKKNDKKKKLTKAVEEAGGE